MKTLLQCAILMATCNVLLAQSNTFDFSNYSYIVPHQWRTQKEPNYVRLAQSHTNEPGCIILLFPPQPSSGNLQQDAENVFSQMYPGWQFRSTGEKQYDLSRGFTPQGLEYFMLEAGMSKLSPDGSRYDGFEDGGALVIKSGTQIVIVAARHTTTLAHTDCVNKYETWRRFFNSFAVKNAAISLMNDEPIKRIIGVWTLTSSGAASGQYVFAANGNYQLEGAVGSTSTSTDDFYKYIHIKTYAFQGDGTYSVAGNQLYLKKGNETEQVQYRFEQVNHGGVGWKDRLYLIKTDPADKTKYEVCYERK